MLLTQTPDVEHMRGVVWALLGAVGLLAVLGIRYPLQMLPLLLFPSGRLHGWGTWTLALVSGILDEIVRKDGEEVPVGETIAPGDLTGTVGGSVSWSAVYDAVGSLAGVAIAPLALWVGFATLLSV